MSHIIVLKGNGESIRYKPESTTYWKDCFYYINKTQSSILGTGFSYFLNKKIPFTIIGTITKYFTDEHFEIQFIKVHAGAYKNTLHYTGIVKDGKIELISNQSSGVIVLN